MEISNLAIEGINRINEKQLGCYPARSKYEPYIDDNQWALYN